MKIFVFAVHKSGSTGVDKFLARVAAELGVDHHSTKSETHPLPRKVGTDDPAMVESLVGKTGIFGVLRHPLVFPDDVRAGAKIVLHLRDPRDALTSMFFSWAYSHVGINDGQREVWKENGIDRFVLENTPGFRERYDILIDRFVGPDDCCLVRYEDFVLDRATWARSFCAFTGISPDLRSIRNWVKNPLDLEGLSRTEDPTRHVRKATPGDHKQKLKPETIAALNAEWGPVLDKLGYER